MLQFYTVDMISNTQKYFFKHYITHNRMQFTQLVIQRD